MSQQTAQFTTFTITEPKSVFTSFKNTLSKYAFHWPLFVLFIAIATLGAGLYLKRIKPTYEVKATLLIKDEGKTSEPQPSALRELDLSNSKEIIENEIEILKSNQLMIQVVRNLNLWASYQKKDKVQVWDLYGKSPVKFIYLSSQDFPDNQVIDIRIKDSKSFSLKMSDGHYKEFPFTQTLTNGFGQWKLEPTEQLTLFPNANISIRLTNPQSLASQYQKAISVNILNKQANAVALSINDEVPQRGKDILNQLIASYNLASLSQKNKETKSTLDFIDERLRSLSGELSQAEKNVAGFKSSRGLTDMSSDSKISLENMQANDARLNEVSVQLSIIDGIERYINSPQNAASVPTTVGINDPALTNLIDKLMQLQLQRDRLLATTPETNPDFEPINKQIYTTKAAIKENIRTIKLSLASTKNQLQVFNNKFESSIKNIPTQEREYISIKRQQAIKENLYTYLLQKREEVAVSYASTLANDRIIDEAYATPAGNQLKVAIYILAFLFGFGLPMAIIFFRDRIKDRVTSIDQIQAATDVPVIGEVSYTSSNDTIKVQTRNSGPISEQFKAIRIALHYLHGDVKKGRTTLITSSVAGEGKTFIAVNLAAALSYSERKTLIIEMDLRRPSMGKMLGEPIRQPGITNFLMGKVKLDDIVTHSDAYPNLDVIRCGSIVDNPSELMEKQELEDLIAYFRTIYDDIIIDSPPVHLVPDAILLSKLSDLTLYVIKQGSTMRSELTFINNLYKKEQLKNMNLVFNGIYSRKYGYGYNYNNLYYSDNESKRADSIFKDFRLRF